MIRPIQNRITQFACTLLAMAGLAASPAASALTAQTITFGTIASQAYGTTLSVSATASSGLPVSFSSSTTGICTVSGSTVSFVATGTCTIAADQAGNATYAAAPEKKQSFSVTNGTQTITFPAIANTTYGVAPFTLNATNSINNPVTFSSSTTSICNVSGTTATIVGVGSCTITAAAGPVTNYNPAQNVAQTFTVSKNNQTITFPAPASMNVGGSNQTLTATASSGLQVAYSVQTPSICSPSGANAVSATAAGTCTIAANQSGNSNYNAATQVTQSFTVLGKAQTITFGALANKAYGSAAFGVSATASSSLAVSFSSATTGVCTVSGSTVTLVAGGTCSVVANQAGNSTYAAAAPVTQSFTVTPIAQTISFAALAGQTYGAAPFTVSATASSGLPVSFGTATTGVCTVSGNSVTITGGGTCTINANQAGNASYNAASQVSQSFTVAPAAQTLSFTAPGNSTYGSTVALTASASSGLAVSLSSATTGVCTVSGSNATMVGVGTCTINANQAGNANYSAASQVSHSFTVAQAAQTISFPTIANPAYGSTVPLNATATSGLAVSFGSSTTGVCTVSGSNLSIIGSGTCTVTASQAGNANYTAATPVSQNLTVTQVPQTITFTAPANSTYGASVALNASASSGLAVAFSSATTAVCTVSGSTANMVGLGTCTVNANQPGNGGYTAAPQVSQSFTVGQAAQTISFTAPATTPFGGSAALSASATSGLAISFTSATTGVCTVSGNTATMVGTGTCTINANQAGNTSYAAAPQVGQSFSASQAAQTITFAAPAAVGYGGSTSLSATASSGLAVSYSTATPAICSVSGATATVVGVGTCTINANQAGNTNYAAATQASQSFTASQATQTISFTAPGNSHYGASVSLSATASSGLAVAFSSATTSICTVSGSTATLVGVGTCTINANQAGNANYSAAAQASQSLTVSQATQTISFPALSAASFGNSVSLNASASSGLAVAYTSATPAVCTVSGNSASVVGAGTCTVNANQAGNTNYAAATQASQSFNATQAAQTISFTAPGNSVYGASVNLSATATSGLAVSFTSATTGICTVSSSTATIVGTGTCTINANQAGNANYSAAAQVSQSFNAAQATQTISFPVLSNSGYGSTVALNASASSGLAVTYATATASVCTVSDNTATVVGVGTCTINANQAGDANHSAAAQASQSFTASQGTQTITFTAPGNSTGGATVSLTASASSGLQVSFASTTPNVCTVSGNTVTPVWAGTCSITASQAGNADYAAAAPVSQSLSVGIPYAGQIWNTSAWTSGTMPSSQSWGFVAYGNNTFVTVAWASNNAAYSTDGGATWKPSTLPSGQNWSNIGYGNGLFIAVARNTSVYATSHDGINWTSYNFPVSDNWCAIAYGNGLYVAVANGSANSAVSTDGINWTIGTLPVSAAWGSIAFGNGRFVALNGNTATAAVSTDGLNWSAGNMPASASWSSITFGQGNFVTVANNTATGAISPDGLNWTQTTLPQSAPWTGIAYGNGLFVAVAGAYSPSDTIGATSEDGVNWSNSTLPVNNNWSGVAYGNNQFVAVSGANFSWYSGTLTRTEINPPTVSITSPTANQSFTAPASINLTANAASSFTGIAQVQYFNGPSLIGSATQAPYTFVWTTPLAGISNITAVATDDAGGSATSAAVPVSVGNLAGTPIAISLSSPSAGQTQPAPAGLTLTASVSDSSGTITQVAFYDNSKLLATYYQAPYTLVIPYALAGTHSYTVQAIDNQGASAASAPVSFTVTPPGPLAISLVNANLGANPAGTAYSMAGAYNGDASNGSLAVDPQGNTYITAYNKDYVQQIKPDNSAGMVWHGLNAPQGILFAKDNSGVLVGTASGLMHLGLDGSITTVNSNPDLGRPYYGPNGVIYTVHGASNTIYQLDGNGQASVYLPSNTVVGAQGMAFDSNGNMLLAVYDSNRIVRINPDKSVQTVLNINGALSILPYGQGWLIGTDSGNNLVDGQWQTVTPLSNTRSDNLIVQANGTVYGAGYGGNGTQELTQSPANPAQTSGTNAITMNSPGNLMLAATTVDSAGSVNQLGFYVNGSLIGTTSPAPYTFNWNNILPGSYTVTAQATDSAGNSAASQPINLTVVGAVITSPTNGQSFQGQPSIVVSATASSTTGSISEVRYFDNGRPLGNVMQSPFNYNWNNVPGGQHTLTAIAIDSSGNSLASAPVSFTVEAPLSVMLTSPSAGTMTNDNFALSASVTEAAGTITQVNYYDGTNLLGTATQAPYGLVFKDITPKTYVLTAQATDSFGRTVTSSAVTVTVVASGAGGGNGGEVVYDIHTDQLNTPRMITDQSGNAVWQWGNLDPFGNNLPNGAGGQFVFNLRFPGQYYDAETGTHYNYFRDYDPAVGRYVESDPIGLLSRQASTYSYVNGNPLTIFDPFGLFGYPEHVSITNSAIGDDPFFPSMGVAVANVDFLPGSQDPANAYWHAMRDGTNGQTVQEAQQLFWQYLDTQISSCTWEGLARALHAAEDSAARGHRNFQPWAGGLPGLSHVEGDFAPTDSEIYIAIQTAKEVLARFKQKCPCGTHSGSAEDVAVPYGAPIF